MFSEHPTPEAAFQLLNDLDAPPRLFRHAEVVHETALKILNCLNLPDNQIDSERIQIGAILHDVGKIAHPEELHQPGHRHEQAGRDLLLAQGVAVEIADLCVTHAQWQSATTLEALIVSLADKLWKGTRIAEMEETILHQIADMQGEGFWTLYATVEPCFEAIAEDALERLNA